jgi:hypothetical protein
MPRAKRKFNKDAVKAADAAVYNLTDPPGRPLDPASKADAELRRKWMEAYADAGGATEVVGSKEAARTKEPCSAEGHNYIELRYLHCNDKPVKNATYHIRSDAYNKDGALDSNGFIRIDGVPEIGGFSYYFDKDPEPYKPAGPNEASEKGRQDATSAMDEIGSWIWGTVQGDFNDKQSICQIAVNTILGLIPVVDQILDVRDIIAGLKNIIFFYMESDEEQAKHDDSLGLSYEAWLWLGVFLIAIGCIPTLGSAVKGVLKGIIRGLQDAGKSASGLSAAQLRHIWEEALRILNRLGVSQGNAHRWLKELVGKLPGLMDDAAARIRDAIDSIQKLVDLAEASARRLSGTVISKVNADDVIARAKRFKTALAKTYNRLEEMKRRLNDWISEQLNVILKGKAPEVKSGSLNADAPTNTLKQGDAAPPTVRTPDEQALVTDLAKRGIKHNPADIVSIRRKPDGTIVFLEKGNSKAGLQHITERHAGDFGARGIPESEIPDLVTKAATEGKPVGTVGTGRNARTVYEVTWNGKPQRVAIGEADNGFIVTAHPAN